MEDVNLSRWKRGWQIATFFFAGAAVLSIVLRVGLSKINDVSIGGIEGNLSHWVILGIGAVIAVLLLRKLFGWIVLLAALIFFVWLIFYGYGEYRSGATLKNETVTIESTTPIEVCGGSSLNKVRVIASPDEWSVPIVNSQAGYRVRWEATNAALPGNQINVMRNGKPLTAEDVANLGDNSKPPITYRFQSNDSEDQEVWVYCVPK